jgi:hypothetical protein
MAIQSDCSERSKANSALGKDVALLWVTTRGPQTVATQESIFHNSPRINFNSVRAVYNGLDVYLVGNEPLSLGQAS